MAVAADTGPSPWAGVWIAEDIEQIAHGVQSGSWIDGTLGAVSAGLDALAFVSDPVGALLQYGVAWLLEHVKPLSEVLDWLAGNPAHIAAHAATWRNVAGRLGEEADSLARSVRDDVSEWSGVAADAYRMHADRRTQSLRALGRASEAMALMTEGAGMLIGTVRVMVRDAVATVVSRLIVYAAELAGSLGALAPLVVEQVTTLCASWAARIARWLKALVASLRRLGDAMARLARNVDQLGGRQDSSGAESAGGVRQTGGEVRRPRNDMDYEMRWADEAYDSIRASDHEIPAVAEAARPYGFTPDDIARIKEHLFRDQHLLDSYPPGEMGRFAANPRIAEAWQRLADGRPHPADIDLLRHERYESDFMARTGDPSYRRAHAATIEAGHAWDPEAAASDGLGYQRRN
ncbi:WXG100 family type VII secretion target [Couchioplanes azureus]|uniref:WXG100 family type VII secretion target n=1 Tax=Couchioplanes caeruleus TaxID=56438 RepID=UPI0016702D83|nr:WXG100 family type VII secretion target [Couchioplanes caeruleus]